MSGVDVDRDAEALRRAAEMVRAFLELDRTAFSAAVLGLTGDDLDMLMTQLIELAAGLARAHAMATSMSPLTTLSPVEAVNKIAGVLLDILDRPEVDPDVD